MHSENEIAPGTGGSQGANENQTSLSVTEYDMPGTETSQSAYSLPMDLSLCALPQVETLAGHGRHHQRAGCDHLSDEEFESALNGFSLGKIVFDYYAKEMTLFGRYDAIIEGFKQAADEEINFPGALRGYVAHIVAVIDGYAAFAQSAPSAAETAQ